MKIINIKRLKEELEKDSAEEVVIKQLIREATIKNARESFWWYCKSMAPDFYTESRTFLREYCEALQAFKEDRIVKFEENTEWKIYSSENEIKVQETMTGKTRITCHDFMINLPPQHGKSRTLVLFTTWCFGKNNNERVITGSYGDLPATEFSMFTRNTIIDCRDGILDKEFIGFSDIFTETKVKQGNASAQKWALEGQHFNYLGAGVGGSVTSKGATLLIADDLVKSAEEAFNENILQKTWVWFSNTFSSRKDANVKSLKKILNMTMWSKGDPVGIITADPELRRDWFRFKRPAYDKKMGKMLSNDILSHEEFLRLEKNARKTKMGHSIFLANYLQEIYDIEGSLYQDLKTYVNLPEGRLKRKMYCDTADEGKDYLCSIVYDVIGEYAYLIDVIYTQQPMTITEDLVAMQLYEYEVNEALVEGNNGGSNFARAVEKITKEKFKNNKTIMKSFKQKLNKMTRIFSNTSYVQKYILFPHDWMYRWPKFYDAIVEYQAQGKNAHDDAPDALTGVAETLIKGVKFKMLL